MQEIDIWGPNPLASDRFKVLTIYRLRILNRVGSEETIKNWQQYLVPKNFLAHSSVDHVRVSVPKSDHFVVYPVFTGLMPQKVNHGLLPPVCVRGAWFDQSDQKVRRVLPERVYVSAWGQIELSEARGPRDRAIIVSRCFLNPAPYYPGFQPLRASRAQDISEPRSGHGSKGGTGLKEKT